MMDRADAVDNLDLAKVTGRDDRPSSWVDAWHHKVDSWMTDPGIYRKAIANPLTRWLTRRRTQQVFDIMSGFVHSQTLLACVRLGIFSIVKQCPATLEELSERCQVPAAALQRLLLTAVSLQLLEWRSQHRFGLGPLGAPIAGYEGIRAMIEHNNLLYQDMAEPLDFLRDAWRGDMAAYWTYAHTPEPAQETGSHPEQVGRYSALMAASQGFVVEEMLSAYAFKAHKCVMDVGCGKGRFIAELAQREPHLAFKLFDLPEVLKLAERNHTELGLVSRMQYHPGSFFQDPLPEGADLVTLVRVAHDHPDEAVMSLLKNICRALAPGGRLLLAEPMAQEPGRPRLADAYFHLYLLAMGAGRLRTATELTDMLRRSGFARVHLLSNPMPIHARLLLAYKA